MRNVVIGMSGGVDSAVSAYLLKKAGYNVTGLFMKNWEDDDDSEYCSSRQDFIDAASAADVIGIDLEAVNFAKEYKERVFSGNIPRAAPPTPMCSVTPRLNSRRFWTKPCAWGRTISQPATTLRCVKRKTALNY